MISQVDSEGHHYQAQTEIRDHSTDGSALKRSNGFIRSCGVNLHAKKTARCCKSDVKWKDGTLIYMPLKDIKASKPVELAEYVVANNIEDEPSFKWWVQGVPRKQDQMISNVKSK